MAGEDSITALFHQLSRLRALRFLWIDIPRCADPHRPQQWFNIARLDFSWLAQLPHLATLRVNFDEDVGLDFKPTVAQVRSIAASCRSLTTIGVGDAWTAELFDAWRSSRPADAAPIQSVCEVVRLLQSSVWPHLIPFAGLTSLCPIFWDLTAAQWSELPRAFPQLRTLRIGTWTAVASDGWVAPVRQCTQLTALKVHKQTLTDGQLQQVLTSLTRLETLELFDAQVDSTTSVNALASAVTLTSLRWHCLLARNADIYWLPLLPSLPLLRRLGESQRPYVLRRTKANAKERRCSRGCRG
jgi:hypothetical protein